MSFGENLVASDGLITTSVAEGFGMVFLESWLAGRTLVGRDLPEITADFVAAGVDLGRLAAQLVLPLDWVGRKAFENDLGEAYRHVLSAYNRPQPSDEELSRQSAPLVQDGLLDFARLSSRLQGNVVRLVASSGSHRERLLELNPTMVAGLAGVPDDATVQVEAKRIRRAAVVFAAVDRAASAATLPADPGFPTGRTNTPGPWYRDPEFLSGIVACPSDSHRLMKNIYRTIIQDQCRPLEPIPTGRMRIFLS